jgi:hypothetical protein
MKLRIAVLAGVAVASLWCSAAGAAPAPVDDGPTEAGVVTGGGPTPEAAGPPPIFQLPFRWDETWQAGSPHEANDSALDFGPRRTGGNDDVVASAAGVVQRVTCSGGSYPQIDHGGGWVSRYYHLVNVDWRLLGRRVLAGTRLGDAGNATPCGGRSTFPHVHFTVLHNGVALSAQGRSMGGYTVHGTGSDYDGYWTDDGSGAVVVRNPNEAKCCLRSTTVPFFVPDQGVLADLNGDGRDDWFLRRSATISISNDSGVPGGDPGAERVLTWGRNTDVLQLGDLSGDGRTDLVHRRGDDYWIEHDLVLAGGDPRPDRHATWGWPTARFYLADVNGDGRDDMILRNGNTIAVSVDTITPGGDVATDLRFRLGQPGDQLHLGDVDGDGDADWVLKRGGTYLVDLDGTPGIDRRFDWGPASGRLHLGDVDGDGRDDFVLRYGARVAISFDTFAPGGSPDTERRLTWGQPADQFLLGDLSGDGRADLVLRRGADTFVNLDAQGAAERSFTAGRSSDQLGIRPSLP